MQNSNMRCLVALLFVGLLFQACSAKKTDHSLHGDWMVMLDSLDRGEKENWYYSQRLEGVEIKLPGSLNQNGIGDDIHVNTQWVGEILDSAWYFEEKYAKYRQPGHIKIPFWLQPNKRKKIQANLSNSSWNGLTGTPKYGLTPHLWVNKIP